MTKTIRNASPYRSDFCQYMLNLAISSADVAGVCKALEHNADPNEIAANDHSPLFNAREISDKAKRKEIVEILKVAGAWHQAADAVAMRRAA